MIDLDRDDLPWIDPAWFVRPDGSDASNTIHGVAHTQRVWLHATQITEVLDFADRMTSEQCQTLVPSSVDSGVP